MGESHLPLAVLRQLDHSKYRWTNIKHRSVSRSIAASACHHWPYCVYLIFQLQQDCTQKITILSATISTTLTVRKRSSCSTGAVRRSRAGGRMPSPYGQQPRAGVVKWALFFGLGTTLFLCFLVNVAQWPPSFLFVAEVTFPFKEFYLIKPRVLNWPKVPLYLAWIWKKQSRCSNLKDMILLWYSLASQMT